MRHRLATVLAALLLEPAVAAQTPALDALFDKGDPAAIEREIQRMTAANADDPLALMAKVNFNLASAGDPAKLDAAVAAAERCVAVAPKLGRCHLWLARALGVKALNGGMLAGLRYAGQIRESFEQAVALAPDDLLARFDLNQFYLIAPAIAGGGRDKAQRNTEDFARLQPARAALLQAQLDLDQDAFAAAEERLLRMPLPDRGEERELWVHTASGLGFGHLQAKPPQFAAAQRVFEAGLKRLPDDPVWRIGLGRVAQEQKQHAAARGQFEQSVALQASARALWRLAQTQEALGDAVNALASYQRALQAWPAPPASVRKQIEERIVALKPL